MLIAEADAPMFDHGKTDEKPMPAPNASTITFNVAATSAPASTYLR
jgi:hypothetical protein